MSPLKKEQMTIKGHELIINERLNREAELLSTALLAEIALARNEPNIARQYYENLLNKTYNPTIAKRLTLLSLTLNYPQKALKSAKIWANSDPENLDAQQIYANLLIHTGNSIDAIPPVLKLINLPAANQSIVYFTSTLLSSPKKHQGNFLKELMKTPAHHSANALFNIAFIFHETGELNASLEAINQALLLQPQWPLGIALQAQVMYANGEKQKAFATLDQAIQHPSGNETLIFMKARLLSDDNNYPAAKQVLERLSKSPEYYGQALIQLADTALRMGQIDDAKKALKKASTIAKVSDSAHYILGEISDYEGHINAAIKQYNAITKGPYRIPAQLKIAMLLAQKGDLQQARMLLNNIPTQTFEQSKQILLIEARMLMQANQGDEALRKLSVALETIPDDLQLLYARGLIAQQLGDYDALEKDLRHIITVDSNQPRALNILGYILTIRNERYDEALGYIQQALALEPENPAILDSMGWVQFQRGRVSEALSYLERAYALDPDPEIAAHLGEVLWATDQRTDAKTIWRKGLETTPNHPAILETLKRLGLNKEML